jgi:hypothetical protein
MINLSDILADQDMGGSAFAYERVTETVGEDGRPAFTVEPRAAVGNIQPAPGRERELLPEEDRLKAVILIYTSAPLTAGEGHYKADRIHYGGVAWRVVLAELWREQAGITKALTDALLPQHLRHCVSIHTPAQGVTACAILLASVA